MRQHVSKNTDGFLFPCHSFSHMLIVKFIALLITSDIRQQTAEEQRDEFEDLTCCFTEKMG